MIQGVLYLKKPVKILLIVLLMLPLNYGCSINAVNEDTIADKMQKATQEAFSQPAANYQNMNKSLYQYYLPISIGKRESTPYSTVLICDNYEVLMSLNASSVIIDKYYASSVSADTMTYDIALYSEVFTGTYSDGKSMNLSVNVFNFNDSYYLLVKTHYFSFLTNCQLTEMPTILKDVIAIARSAKIDQTAVLAAYSKKESINYQQETMTIFSQAIPENGTLAEMLENYFPDYDFTGDSQSDTQDSDTLPSDYVTGDDTEEVNE